MGNCCSSKEKKVRFNLIRTIGLFSIIFIIYLLIPSCNEAENKPMVDGQDSSSVMNERIPYNPFPLINYTLDTIENRQHLNSLLARFKNTPQNKSSFRAFTTLNRKELRFISVGSAVVIPDTIINDLRAYSIFPNYYEGAKDIKKLVVVSAVYQSYACYEYGKLVRFAATNTGKERTPTFPGRYAMSWKEKVHRSSIDSTWMMPFTINIHLQAGSAMHNFEMPGKPASHSCLRQFLEDSEWIYYWGEMIKFDSLRKPKPMSGTPLIIIDHYDFSPGSGYRWKYLKSNHDEVLRLPANPMEVEEALIPICQIPTDARGGLRNIKRYISAEDTLRAKGIIREGVKLIETKNFNKIRRMKQEQERKKLEMQQMNRGGQ